MLPNIALTGSAGVVLSAVGGHVSAIAAMAGVRLPIRTHQLQAFVTTRYANTFAPIVASSGLGVYASQTAKGEMLIGAEIDRAPAYAYDAGPAFLQSCAFRAIALLPFLRDLQVLRQWTGVCDMSADYSPIMGFTSAPNFLVTTGWGTWGFKAIPAGGEQMAELIATGRTPALVDGDFTIKRYRNRGGQIRLMAENPVFVDIPSNQLAILPDTGASIISELRLSIHLSA